MNEPQRNAMYWENRGRWDWRPVTLTIRYGPTRDLPPSPFPGVRTSRRPPRNVAIRRADGAVRVVPVRTLRCRKPH